MKLFSEFGFGHRFMDAGSLDPVSNRSSEFQRDTRLFDSWVESGKHKKLHNDFFPTYCCTGSTIKF